SRGISRYVTIHQEPESCDVGSAVNAPSLPWNTGGQAEWFCQSVETYDGVLSAQSGNVEPHQQSWAETAVTGAGVLNFWWRVDAVGAGSGLEFSADATTLNLSGASGWRRVSTLLPDGIHDVRWTFSRGSSASSAMKAAWLDRVQWHPDGPEGTVYRFWSPLYQSHFFTRSLSERNLIISNWPDVWWFEGSAWYSYTSQVPGSLPVFRFWSSTRGTHFYTINQAERDFIIANWGSVWRYEGIAWYAFPHQEMDTVPVYRFWSPVSQAHFYTRSTGERDHIIATWPQQWTYEGIAFYVRESADPGLAAFASKSQNASTPMQPLTAYTSGFAVDPNGNLKQATEALSTMPTGVVHRTRFVADAQTNAPEMYSVHLPLDLNNAERTAMLYDASRNQWREIVHPTSNSSVLDITGLVEGISYWLALFSRDDTTHSWRLDQGSWLGRFREPPSFSDRLEDSVAASNALPIERITMPMFEGRMSLVMHDEKGLVLARYDNLESTSAVFLTVPSWNRWFHIAIYDHASGTLLATKWLGHIRTH
ncbi:MAG TPA: hypothetical protein PKC18_14410, partial [Lacipirellulaceae bacterium]|nr:hypothetical protein [Lacipirellulaceae bacterium]